MEKLIQVIYSGIMSIFITALFIFDIAGHTAIYSNGKSIKNILFERGNLFILAALYITAAFIALVIDAESVNYLKSIFGRAADGIWGTLNNWRGLLFAMLVVILFYCIINVFNEQSISLLISNILREIGIFIKGKLSSIAVLIVAFGFYYSAKLVARLMANSVSPGDAFIGWSAGTTIMFILVITAGLYRSRIGNSFDESGVSWTDVLKDYSLYFLITVVYIGGLTRWANAVNPQSIDSAVYLWMALLGAVFCVGILGFLDFYYICRIPNELLQKKEIIRDFIHGRDLVILIPMCFIQAVYLIWRVVIVPRRG